MEGWKQDDYILHPTDSTQCHIINHKYGSFADDPRNLRFGLSTDGMNPFGQMSSSQCLASVGVDLQSSALALQQEEIHDDVNDHLRSASARH